MKSTRLPLLLFLLIAGTAGCDLFGDDDEDFDEVAGMWSATTFTLQVEGETHDILEAGGELAMTLNEDGTVDDGILRAPCSIPGICPDGEEGDFEEAFEGTFDIEGQTVTFSHAADTFIRDVLWVFDGTTLSTSTAVITAVLER